MCSGCGREFSTRNLLQGHINMKQYETSNNNNSKNTFKCSGKVSGARVIYPCKLCGKFFTRKDNLRNHLRRYVKTQECDKTDKTARPNNRNTYECLTCGQSFGGSSLLSLHSLIHKRCNTEQETNSNIHRCNKCGKVFAFLSTLKQHQYNCELRKFSDLDASRYKCSKCSSVFNSKLQLTGHSRMHSTLEKPHKCPFCESRFMNPAQLKLHLLTHKSCGKNNIHSYFRRQYLVLRIL